jgi:hypothetical protein
MLKKQQANKELTMKSMSLAILAVFLASAANAAEKPSQVFLKKAIEGNYAEVQMGNNDPPPADGNSGTAGSDGTVARHGTGDSDEEPTVTNLMIAAGIAELPAHALGTLQETEAMLRRVYRGMCRVRDL